MVAKRGLDAGRLSKMAAKSAAAAEKLLLPPGSETKFTCEYLGIADGSGNVQPDAKVRLESEAIFEWCALPGGFCGWCYTFL